MSEGWDSGTKEVVRKIPLLTVSRQRFWSFFAIRLTCSADNVGIGHCRSSGHLYLFPCTNLFVTAQIRAGPRDKEEWGKRLKEVRKHKQLQEEGADCCFDACTEPSLQQRAWQAGLAA